MLTHQVRIATALRAAGITAVLGADFGRELFPTLKARPSLHPNPTPNASASLSETDGAP